MLDHQNRSRSRAVAGALAIALAGTLVAATPATAAPADPGPTSPATSAAPLTNLAHLDFLLDTATPPEQAGHTTYRIDEEPELTFLWTYADARPGGTFERVGGGPLDPATGYWGQGAYNADDVSRAAVVYLRHWQQTGADSSRESAYELLRGLAYLQTVEGPDAGNVVLWMQPDGRLNPSAEPVELPDPSDSDASYWLARTLWAFGEGYAAFVDDDPEFAGFLRDRLALARDAVDRQVLDRYGDYVQSDGMRVPAWLITDGADATAEAVLGLAAYVEAAPDDAAARDTLAKLAEGVAAMGAGDTRSWPYGAILPWAQSRAIWHSWASQMPAALAKASTVLDRDELLAPAVADSATFTPVLLTASGPDNGWNPSPVDQVQIAYGADSRLQSLLAVADATGSTGFEELAAVEAAWYFGANRSSAPVYDPTTGVTFDGVQPDGSVNRNSGAESAIHGLLSMLALDAHPEVAARATSVASVVAREGLVSVEAETAVTDAGSVVTPESAWTGESSLSGGSYLSLPKGARATIEIPQGTGPRSIEAVTWAQPATSRTIWTSGRLPLGVLATRAGEQGISAAPRALLPQLLRVPVLSGSESVSVRAVTGTTDIDALLIRPAVSRLELAGPGGVTTLLHSTGQLPLPTSVGTAGETSTVRVYDARGVLVTERALTGASKVTLQPGGFAVVTR